MASFVAALPEQSPTAPGTGSKHRPAVAVLPRLLGMTFRTCLVPAWQGLRQRSCEVQFTSETQLAASEQVAVHLRSRILTGDMAPGQRLLQQDLADEFGTSRLPVREPLRMLAADGLGELDANKGSRVPVLDQAELSIVYKIRERLEPSPGLGACRTSAST